MSDVMDHDMRAPGQPAEVDDQGRFPTCVIHSVAKAFCDGCDRGKWTGGITFDARQPEAVLSFMALFPNPGEMWPSALHGKTFEVFDKKSQSTGKFEIKVTTMKKSFQWIDQTEYYVLTYSHPKVGNHCVYVETYNEQTGTFGCMNSWGPISQPRPLIKEADVIQVDMIEFELKDSSFKQKLDDEKSCLSTASSNSLIVASPHKVKLRKSSSFKQTLDDEKRHSNCLSTASSNKVKLRKSSSFKRKLDVEKRHSSCLSNASSNSSFHMIEIELRESSFEQELDDMKMQSSCISTTSSNSSFHSCHSTASSNPLFHHAIGLFASPLPFHKTEGRAVVHGRAVRNSCVF